MGDSIYNYVYQFNIFESDYEALPPDSDGASIYSCSSTANGYSNIDKTKCIYSMKYLKHLEGRNTNNNFVGGCKYLNYKLCDIVKDEMFKYDSLTLLKKMKTENEGYFDNDICDDNIQNLSEEIINNVKKLINLYDNFHNIKSDSISNGNINCGMAKACAYSYMSYGETCKSQKDHEFCNEL
ncbi:hypothetical protein PVT01_000011700 [Plasmodium vivax]|uniref:VIR protein n=1 Tax=Plasmodium vivax TaxID=5855 RepID=A0A1G4EA41_PLAVI|nr:hypothetical protein PVT01_000011700 [Plasmodium vivax]